MKKMILLMTMVLAYSANARNVDFAQIDIKLTIDATQAADPYDKSNEYQVAFSLREKETGNIYAYLEGSTAIPGKVFGGWSRVDVGEQIVFETRVRLPQSLLDFFDLSVYIVERDPVIPILGPCCLYLSNHDILLRDQFELTGFLYLQKRLFFERAGGNAIIEMIKIDWGQTDISSLLDFQFENVLRVDSFTKNKFIEFIELINQQ